MTIAYIRTVLRARSGLDYVPQGPDREGLKTTFVEEDYYEFEWPCKKDANRTNPSDVEKQQSRPERRTPGYYIHTLDMDAIFRGDIPPPPGTDDFSRRDVFQCDPNGLPIWCGTCKNWKPDRAHHCSDDGRCVRKLDHFCPWVGGVVSEANFKFFVQFNFYAVLYTVYIMILSAYVISEQRRDSSNTLNACWIIAVAIAAMFLFFTSGMALKSCQDLLKNLTTVDAIDHTRRTVFLAVRLPDDQRAPRPVPHAREPIPWHGTIAYPFVAPGANQGPSVTMPRTTFAILCTPPGMNPWDLGAKGNWCAVMGDSMLDWILPIRDSPCADGGDGKSMYALGPAFDDLIARAGIVLDRRSSRRRSQRRLTEKS